MKREQQNKLPYMSPQCDIVKIENIDFLCVSVRTDVRNNTSPSGYENRGEHNVGTIRVGRKNAPARGMMFFEDDVEC